MLSHTSQIAQLAQPSTRDDKLQSSVSLAHASFENIVISFLHFKSNQGEGEFEGPVQLTWL